MSRLGNNPLFGMTEGNEAGKQPDAKQDQEKSKGRPRNPELVRGNSVQEGLTEDYTRATFIVRRDLLETMKDFAYWERLTLKDVVNDALEQYLKDKDVKNRRK